MYKKLETLWRMIIDEANGIKDQEIIVMNNYELFLDNFKLLYSSLKKEYMSPEVEFLDRHKVAAIIIYSVINANVLNSKSSSNETIYIDNYRLAISAGLSYMQYELNHYLSTNNKKTIEKFSFPDVTSGNKTYLEHLINLLYISKEKDCMYNLLTMANILFLIEKYTLK